MIKLNPNLDVYGDNIALWEKGQTGGRTKPINIDNLFQNMVEVKEVFNKYGIRYCLSHGTMLGIYRQQDLIPHDDDVDLAIFKEIKGNNLISMKVFKEYFEPIREELRDKGFFVPQCGDPNKPINIKDNMPYYDEVFIKNGEKIEGWIFENKGNSYIYDEPRCGNDLKHSSKYYDKLDTIEWRCHTWPIPANIKSYLTMMYGPTYMTPDANKKYNNQS